MRSLLLIVFSAALAGGMVAPAAAVPEDGANSFACKVLRSAIHETEIGDHATRFANATTGCVANSLGGDPPWTALLILKTGSKHARAACKLLLADKSLSVRRWLTKGESGAELACLGASSSPDRFSDTIYFDKGRWTGTLGREGPKGAQGGLYLTLRRLTAQLPR
jgi:hypothetical protein